MTAFKTERFNNLNIQITIDFKVDMELNIKEDNGVIGFLDLSLLLLDGNTESIITIDESSFKEKGINVKPDALNYLRAKITEAVLTANLQQCKMNTTKMRG